MKKTNKNALEWAKINSFSPHPGCSMGTPPVAGPREGGKLMFSNRIYIKSTLYMVQQANNAAKFWIANLNYTVKGGVDEKYKFLDYK